MFRNTEQIECSGTLNILSVHLCGVYVSLQGYQMDEELGVACAVYMPVYWVTKWMRNSVLPVLCICQFTGLPNGFWNPALPVRCVCQFAGLPNG